MEELVQPMNPKFWEPRMTMLILTKSSQGQEKAFPLYTAVSKKLNREQVSLGSMLVHK